MSHHTSDKPLTAPFLESVTNSGREKIKQLDETLGPTKDFPDGRLVAHDEGGLLFGVTVFSGRVIFDFGKPIRSIGFTREGALELAELIRQRAMQCPPILKKTVPHR